MPSATKGMIIRKIKQLGAVRQGGRAAVNCLVAKYETEIAICNVYLQECAMGHVITGHVLFLIHKPSV